MLTIMKSLSSARSLQNSGSLGDHPGCLKGPKDTEQQAQDTDQKRTELEAI